MTAIRRSKLAGPLSILLAAAMMTLMIPVGLVSPAEAQGEARMLLIFPVLDRSEAGYPDVAERMTAALQIAIADIAGLRSAEFSPSSPMVRRAVKEGRIRSVDVEAEVADAATAIQIGYALGVDEVCLAMITAVTVQEEPRRIEVVLSGQCYDVASNMDPDSKQVVERPVVSNSFGVSGQSRERADYRGSDSPLLHEAVRAAAQAAAQVLAGKSVEEMAKVGVGRPSRAMRWVILGALLIGLAAVAHNATSHPASGPSPEAVAPRPLSMDVEPTSIRLYWQPPQGTSLVVLRYEIRRSVNNGAWNLIDDGNVDANDTSFPDFDVQGGNGYAYSIRAQYTTTGPSPWANFDQVTFPD
jgi:hypothetical protein